MDVRLRSGALLVAAALGGLAVANRAGALAKLGRRTTVRVVRQGR
jgi:hypothetical protein